jgi:chromosome segregation ATPase
VNWGTAFQFAVAALTVLAGIYATRSARRGKDAETLQQALAVQTAEEQEDRKQRFEELRVSLEAARKDLEYYSAQLERARSEAHRAVTEKDELQQEWIERHAKLLARCQALADQLEAVLAGPLTLPTATRAQIEHAIGEVERHVRDDHLHFD